MCASTGLNGAWSVHLWERKCPEGRADWSTDLLVGLCKVGACRLSVSCQILHPAWWWEEGPDTSLPRLCPVCVIQLSILTAFHSTQTPTRQIHTHTHALTQTLTYSSQCQLGTMSTNSCVGTWWNISKLQTRPSVEVRWSAFWSEQMGPKW